MSAKTKAQPRVFICIFTYLVSQATLDLSVLIYQSPAPPNACFTFVISVIYAEICSLIIGPIFSYILDYSALPLTKPPCHFQEFNHVFCL